MSPTTIEWTDETWNPVRGCTKVSPGCAHCYAETFAERFRGVKGHAYEQGFDLRLVPEKLSEPLTWQKPRRVFVNSMSDLFQEGVPDVFIERVFSVMALAERHTFQVLTKRPERMLAWFRARRFDVKGYAILQTEQAGECLYAHPWPLPNVWLGVSVEKQHFAKERIPLLLQCPASVRFISAEPLLWPVEFTYNQLCTTAGLGPPDPPRRPNTDSSVLAADRVRQLQWALGPNRISWVIIGGESGGHARPLNLEWARSIVKQCSDAGVAAFVKQVGVEYEQRIVNGGTFTDPTWRDRVKHPKGADPSEWPADLRVRQFPPAFHGSFWIRYAAKAGLS